MTTSAEQLLRGNGAELVKERALAAKVQRALERLYRIEDAPEVDAFLERASDGEREALFLRHANDGALEIMLRVPRLDGDLDPLCQLIEGVSHFVYITERARTDREATHLELEVQAEVDKYVVLAASVEAQRGSGAIGVRESEALRARLFERVAFEDRAETERGNRYRIANAVAANFVRRLERDYVAPRRYAAMHVELRRFFQMGQEEKLRLGRAA